MTAPNIDSIAWNFLTLEQCVFQGCALFKSKLFPAILFPRLHRQRKASRRWHVRVPSSSMFIALRLRHNSPGYNKGEFEHLHKQTRPMSVLLTHELCKIKATWNVAKKLLIKISKSERHFYVVSLKSFVTVSKFS